MDEPARRSARLIVHHDHRGRHRYRSRLCARQHGRDHRVPVGLIPDRMVHRSTAPAPPRTARRRLTGSGGTLASGTDHAAPGRAGGDEDLDGISGCAPGGVVPSPVGGIVCKRTRYSAISFAHVPFAKRWPHSSHLNSWQSLLPPMRPCAAVPHSGQVMQVSSAPSSPRTFSFVNTAGAVPGEASVARNIARTYSLRERGLVIVVSPFHSRLPSVVAAAIRAANGVLLAIAPSLLL